MKMHEFNKEIFSIQWDEVGFLFVVNLYINQANMSHQLIILNFKSREVSTASLADYSFYFTRIWFLIPWVRKKATWTRI
jgi:Tfp pilus assembly ATPase PilU